MNNTVNADEKSASPTTSHRITSETTGIYDTHLREVRLSEPGTIKNDAIPVLNRIAAEPPKEYTEDSAFLDDILVMAGVHEVKNQYDGDGLDDCESECDVFRYSKCGDVDLDTLKLSGVVPSEWTEEDFPEIEQDYKIKLLKRVCADLPEKMVLELGRQHLNINGVPTKISSKAVEQAFFGLAELMGRERALTKVSGLVHKKLKCLY